jgi:hypothetical protein
VANTLLRLSRSAVLLALLAGCAGSTQSPAGGGDGPDRITVTDAHRARFSNALELVQHSRAGWLRGRGAPSLMLSSPIQVYVNDRPFGNASRLQDVSLQDVERLVFLDASSATTRFGTGNVSGAILVVLRQ